MTVSEADLILPHGGGNRKRGATWCAIGIAQLSLQLLQITLARFYRAGEFGDSQGLHITYVSIGLIDPAKAGIAAAYVGHQPWIGRRVGRVSDQIHHAHVGDFPVCSFFM